MKFRFTFCLYFLLPAVAFTQDLSAVKQQLNNKNYKGVITQASEILASGENAEAYLLRAKAYHQLKNYKSEITDYKKALELEENPNTRLSLAFAYQASRDTVESNRLTKLNIELYPDHIPSILYSAASAGSKKQNDLALKILTDAYKKYDSPLLLQARAAEYRRQGKYEKALSDYEMLLLTRKSSSTYMSAAQCASQIGNYKKTLQYYEEYLKFNPNSSAALNNVGHELRKIGKFKDAEIYYKKAIDVSPRNAYPLVGQTVVAYMQGDADKAFSIIDAALLLETKSKIAAMARGSLNLYEGDLEAAEADLKQALSDPQQVKYAYPTLATVFIYKGEYARAVDFITDQIETQTIPSADAHNIRGFAYYKMGKTEEAIKDFLHALELDNDYQPVFRYLEKSTRQAVKNYTHLQFFSPLNDVNNCKSGFFTDEKKEFDFKIRIISNEEVDTSKITLYESGKAVDPKYWSVKGLEKLDFKFMNMLVTDVSLQYIPNKNKSQLTLSYAGTETQTLTLIK